MPLQRFLVEVSRIGTALDKTVNSRSISGEEGTS